MNKSASVNNSDQKPKKKSRKPRTDIDMKYNIEFSDDSYYKIKHDEYQDYNDISIKSEEKDIYHNSDDSVDQIFEMTDCQTECNDYYTNDNDYHETNDMLDYITTELPARNFMAYLDNNTGIFDDKKQYENNYVPLSQETPDNTYVPNQISQIDF